MALQFYLILAMVLPALAGRVNIAPEHAVVSSADSSQSYTDGASVLHKAKIAVIGPRKPNTIDTPTSSASTFVGSNTTTIAESAITSSVDSPGSLPPSWTQTTLTTLVSLPGNYSNEATITNTPVSSNIESLPAPEATSASWTTSWTTLSTKTFVSWSMGTSIIVIPGPTVSTMPTASSSAAGSLVMPSQSSNASLSEPVSTATPWSTSSWSTSWTTLSTKTYVSWLTGTSIIVIPGPTASTMSMASTLSTVNSTFVTPSSIVTQPQPVETSAPPSAETTILLTRTYIKTLTGVSVIVYSGSSAVSTLSTDSASVDVSATPMLPSNVTVTITATATATRTATLTRTTTTTTSECTITATTASMSTGTSSSCCGMPASASHGSSSTRTTTKKGCCTSSTTTKGRSRSTTKTAHGSTRVVTTTACPTSVSSSSSNSVTTFVRVTN